MDQGREGHSGKKQQGNMVQVLGKQIKLIFSNHKVYPKCFGKVILPKFLLSAVLAFSAF